MSEEDARNVELLLSKARHKRLKDVGVPFFVLCIVVYEQYRAQSQKRMRIQGKINSCLVRPWSGSGEVRTVSSLRFFSL